MDVRRYAPLLPPDLIRRVGDRASERGDGVEPPGEYRDLAADLGVVQLGRNNIWRRRVCGAEQEDEFVRLVGEQVQPQQAGSINCSR